MCGECRARTALAKELAKEANFPDDPRSVDEIWWAEDLGLEEAERSVRRADNLVAGLEAQGFKIVEA